MDKALIKTLSEGATAIGVRLDPTALDLFSAYHRELLLWNRRINLVSESSAKQLVIRHFLDSLTPAPFLDRPDGALIDLGSGGGFPGIPLRIALPGLHVSLVEASRKKSSFLSHIVRTLRIGGVQVIRERVEVLTAGETLAGRFDALVSRAAFKLPELLRMASFFLKPGGQLIAMKGPVSQEEMAETERISAAAGMVFTALRDVRPTGADSLRILVTYNRVSG
ncbi:MAG: 16S rRNA (guanine(527)-N(7))-methyltransferase RsmG [Deltaproteobacteria bacterium]|nr:16S rRNA (guanine(527)-N(7))-methyltransferase RsmG [Deltaproteobacteria bacterium]